jgi:hypothetical protein
MEPKDFSTINLTQKEIKDIQQFCKLNKIEDIPTFLHTCAWKGYEVEKFGILGKTGGIQEKRVEIEVIREKRVEIPVEVIKEVVKVEYVEVPVEVIKEVIVDKIVEVIKEVPVDKVVIKEVIKEVPVEKVVTKIEYISDKTSENELLLKLQQLENEKQEFSTKLTETEQKLQLFSTKTTEMENIFQNKIKDLESREPEKVEIIKEVIVEKTTTDNSKQKALEETIQKIRTELQLKNKEINDLKLTISDIQKQGGSKSVYMDGSNLGKILR